MTRPTQMRAFSTLVLLALLLAVPASASADRRFIVRTAGTTDGLPVLTMLCRLLGCSVSSRVDGSVGQLFVVTAPNWANDQSFVGLMSSLVGVSDAMPDPIARTDTAAAGAIPPALLDGELVNYYGTTVRHGYVDQPATRILGLGDVQSAQGLTGRGTTVAVIDTGVDPNHPALAGVLTSGYDFTRNVGGGSEMADVSQSTVAVLDNATPAYVNQSTVAVLDQSTVAVLDAARHASFGHGTMVAGIVHLTAPRARIMPLKAFGSDGTAYLSDVLRAIYYAIRSDVNVINMSFSFAEPSRELARAIAHAQQKGIVTIASAGNDGQKISVYPASIANVIGVASTSDVDTLSPFSNFGPQVAYIAGPGEGIVTPYPFGSYAAAWGTSFSAPFAAGTAALLAQVSSDLTNAQAADAEGNGVFITAELKRGRLDIPAAVRALRARLPQPR